MESYEKSFDDVEDVFAGEVGCRSRRNVFRHVEPPATVFTSDYSHSGRIVKSKGAAVTFSPRRIISAGNIT